MDDHYTDIPIQRGRSPEVQKRLDDLQHRCEVFTRQLAEIEQESRALRITNEPASEGPQEIGDHWICALTTPPHTDEPFIWCRDRTGTVRLVAYDREWQIWYTTQQKEDNEIVELGPISFTHWCPCPYRLQENPKAIWLDKPPLARPQAHYATKLGALQIIGFSFMVGDTIVVDEELEREPPPNLTWPRGTPVKATQDIDPTGANVKRGDVGVIFEESDAYGDGCGPMVRWYRGGACNVYPGQVVRVREGDAE